MLSDVMLMVLTSMIRSTLRIVMRFRVLLLLFTRPSLLLRRRLVLLSSRPTPPALTMMRLLSRLTRNRLLRLLRLTTVSPRRRFATALRLRLPLQSIPLMLLALFTLGSETMSSSRVLRRAHIARMSSRLTIRLRTTYILPS